MRKTIITLLAAGMLLPPLNADVLNRFVSDTWYQRHTLTLHDSGTFATVTETFRDQKVHDWMRFRTDISARYGNWHRHGAAITLEFEDGTVLHAVPSFNEYAVLGLETEDGFFPLTEANLETSDWKENPFHPCPTHR